MSKTISSATNEAEYSRSGGGRFYYTVKNGKCIITNYLEAELIIPSEIKGVPVTEIGDSAFAGCKGLVGVTIPDSVKVIGNGAFQYCTSLTDIKIPNSVEEIGEQTFWNCAELIGITIPDSVKVIGYGAFLGCEKLRSVSVPKSVEIVEGAFEGCPNIRLRRR